MKKSTPRPRWGGRAKFEDLDRDGCPLRRSDARRWLRGAHRAKLATAAKRRAIITREQLGYCSSPPHFLIIDECERMPVRYAVPSCSLLGSIPGRGHKPLHKPWEERVPYVN